MASGEAFVVEGKLRVPYDNWYGTLASAFFRELRDHGKIRGIRCPACEKVYMPPRSVCPRCLGTLSEWVDLPPTGTLETFTVVHYDYGQYYQPMKPPYLLGIIRLDGADTGLCHLLGELEEQELAPGLRVEARFREDRKGNILDIVYFRPIR